MPRQAQPFSVWTKAAHALSTQAAGQVECPECGTLSLNARDVMYGSGHDCGVQRYLTCTSCHAFQVVNLKRAGALSANH